MQERLEQLEKTIFVLHEEITELKDLLGSGFKKVENNFESVKTHVDNLSATVKQLNISVDSLKGSTNEGFDSVNFTLENLTDEIMKIGEVTKYDEQYENLRFFRKN